MKKSTLEKMQTDSTMSDIQRMAAGCLVETRKANGHRDLAAASEKLQARCKISESEAAEYVEMVATDADNREWTG